MRLVLSATGDQRGCRHRKYLQLAGYGSLREPFDLTRFWLDGSLQVSAEEQIALLRKLYQRSLPFSTRSYDTLRQVMLAEQGTATGCMPKPAGPPASSRKPAGMSVMWKMAARCGCSPAISISITPASCRCGRR